MNQTYGPTMMPGPPGMEAPPPPGWMGMTPQAAGYGGPKFGPQAGVQGMQQAQAQAGSMFGGSVMNAAAGAAHTAYQVTSFGAMTVAPLLATYGSTMAIRGVGTAWSMTDPFQVGMVGGRAGWAMAEGMGMGMGGRMALGAVGMGTVGAVAAAPALMAQSWIEHSLKGARDAMLGRSTLQSTSVGSRGGVSAGQGAMFGRDLASLSSEMGTSTDELASLTKQLDQMKVFQSTQNVGEFRSKFKEVLGAIKEIAKTTKQTLEDATQTFGELKQQGFYTTADVTAQAVKRSAQSKMSGVDEGTLSAYGGMGAQMARSMGMKGRYGSDFMTQQVSSMATAYRGMSASNQEIVNEHGGPEEMAASLASKQMRFLSSARGRVMIAASLGEGGAPSSEGLARILGGGQTTESLVETAAGRGLGTLMQAGRPETRQQYMQYAGMMQLMMASSQSKQLYGGTSTRGLETMMGTMGYGREETRVLLAQTMQMPKILEQQANSQTLALQQAGYAQKKLEGSWSHRFGATVGHYTDSWEGSGGRGMARLSSSYERAANSLAGYHENTLGASGLSRLRGLDGKETDSVMGGLSRLGGKYEGLGENWFGPKGEREQILHDYGGYTQKGRKFGDTYQDADGKDLKGDFIELEWGTTGDEIQIIDRKKLQKAQRVGREEARKFDAKSQGKLENLLATGYTDGSVMGVLGGSVGRLSNWAGGINGQVGSGNLGLDFDRQMLAGYEGKGENHLTSEEINAYSIMRKADIPGVPKDVKDFIRMKKEKPHEFQRLQRSLGESMKEAGWDEEKIRQTVGGPALAGSSMTREAARKRLEKSLTDVGLSDQLITDVTTNSEKAVAFDTYMQALGKGDSTGEAAARRQLKKLGVDTSEIDRANSWDKEAMGKKWQKDKVSDDITMNIAATAFGGRTDRAASAISKHQTRLRDGTAKGAEAGQSAATEAAVTKLAAAGEDGKKRSQAFTELYASLMSGGISRPEKEYLATVTGGKEAAGIAKNIEALAGTSVERKAAMEALGISGSEEDLDKELGKSTGEERLKKANQYAWKKGKIDDAYYSAGADEKTVEGAHQEYIEANTQFVVAVNDFVKSLATAFPDLKLSSGAVTQTAEGLPK